MRSERLKLARERAMSALRRAQATKPGSLRHMLFFPLLSYNLYPRYIPKKIGHQYMRSRRPKDSLLLLLLIALGYKRQHFICLCSCFLLSYIYIWTRCKKWNSLVGWEVESSKNNVLHLSCRSFSEQVTKHKNTPSSASIPFFISNTSFSKY